MNNFQCNKIILYIYIFHRKKLGLTRYAQYTAIVGKTHIQSSADALQKVYPKVADIEVFPGGVFTA